VKQRVVRVISSAGSRNQNGKDVSEKENSKKERYSLSDFSDLLRA
jgi:hypothetical protein